MNTEEKLAAARKLFCSEDTTDLPVRIVIGHRGWVWVGHFTQDGDLVRLLNARVIRKWNTTRGLAELVSGPGEATLDAKCAMRVHEASIIAQYECDAAGWADALS